MPHDHHGAQHCCSCQKFAGAKARAGAATLTSIDSAIAANTIVFMSLSPQAETGRSRGAKRDEVTFAKLQMSYKPKYLAGPIEWYRHNTPTSGVQHSSSHQECY
jgi:hypothetical protein